MILIDCPLNSTSYKVNLSFDRISSFKSKIIFFHPILSISSIENTSISSKSKGISGPKRLLLILLFLEIYNSNTYTIFQTSDDLSFKPINMTLFYWNVWENLNSTTIKIPMTAFTKADTIVGDVEVFQVDCGFNHILIPLSFHFMNENFQISLIIWIWQNLNFINNFVFFCIFLILLLNRVHSHIYFLHILG